MPEGDGSLQMRRVQSPRRIRRLRLLVQQASTRSAAATEAWRSLSRLAASRMGPENFREYSTKEVRLPMEMPPPMNSSPPNTLMAARDRLLMKLTEGPREALAQSAR